MSYVNPLFPGMLLAAIVAVLLSRRYPRLSRRVALGSLVCLALAGWRPVAMLASYTLESHYDSDGPGANAVEPPSMAQAIVILSAGTRLLRPSQPAAIADSRTDARSRHGAWLYLEFRAKGHDLPVVVTGGLVSSSATVSHADVMREILVQAGVPSSAVMLERKSRNTRQNAAFTRELLATRGIDRIVLVTDAIHMLRSELCFRKVGFEVTASPIDFERPLSLEHPTDWIPQAGSLGRVDDVIHEWLGLGYYWLRGWV